MVAEKKKIEVRIMRGSFSVEEEVDLDSISFENGRLKIGEELFDIQVFGDELNVPIAFVSNFGDGFPRIICNHPGKSWLLIPHQQTDWFMNDVILHPVQNAIA